MYDILGPEFGPDEGKMTIIVIALYGLKSAGISLQNHLDKFIQFMGYKTCLDGPDMWMSPMKTSSDDFEHYEYALLYVDDALAIGNDPTEVLQNTGKYFGLKPGSLSDPKIYLGANLKPTRMENGVVVWYLILSQYIQEAVNNTEIYVKENLGYWWKIPKTYVNPLPCGYEPHLDVLPELHPVLPSYYQY